MSSFKTLVILLGLCTSTILDKVVVVGLVLTDIVMPDVNVYSKKHFRKLSPG